MGGLGRWSGSGLIARPQIALFGGSFDPVHNAHLHILRSVSSCLKLTDLFVIPCHQPPHKAGLVASNAERLAMLALAVEGLPAVAVDARELQRDKLSYTYDTVAQYRQERGEDVSLIFIIGEDSWLDFTSWHRWREILQKVNLLVLKRPDIAQQADLERSHQELQDYFTKHSLAAEELGFFSSGKIAMLDNRELAIASKTIRRNIASGGTEFYDWVPPKVADYIVQNGLYRQA